MSECVGRALGDCVRVRRRCERVRVERGARHSGRASQSRRERSVVHARVRRITQHEAGPLAYGEALPLYTPLASPLRHTPGRTSAARMNTGVVMNGYVESGDKHIHASAGAVCAAWQRAFVTILPQNVDALKNRSCV